MHPPPNPPPAQTRFHSGNRWHKPDPRPRPSAEEGLPQGWPQNPLVLPPPTPVEKWGEPYKDGHYILRYHIQNGPSVPNTKPLHPNEPRDPNRLHWQLSIACRENIAWMCEKLGMQRLDQTPEGNIILADTRPGILMGLAPLFTKAQRKDLQIDHIVPESQDPSPPGPAPLVCRIPIHQASLHAGGQSWALDTRLRRRREIFLYLGDPADIEASKVLKMAGWTFSPALLVPWTPHARSAAPLGALGCKETRQSLAKGKLPRGLIQHMRHGPCLFPWRGAWALTVPNEWNPPEKAWAPSNDRDKPYGGSGYTGKNPAAAHRMSAYAPEPLQRILNDAHTSGGLRALDPGKITLIDSMPSLTGTGNDNPDDEEDPTLHGLGNRTREPTENQYPVRKCPNCEEIVADPNLAKPPEQGKPCPKGARCMSIKNGQIPIREIPYGHVTQLRKHASPRAWRETGEKLALPLIQAQKQDDSLWDDDRIRGYLPPGATFRSSQLEGIRHALTRPVSLDATIMGGGKTLKALVCFAATLEQNPQELGSRRCLAVVPASLVTKWLREANRWLGHIAPIRVEPVQRNRPIPPSGIVIASYDALRLRDQEFAQAPWAMVCADEAHYAKNPRADRSQALLNLKAERWLFLTGTPVHNRPIDLQPLLAKACPQAFDQPTRFRRAYGIKDPKNLTPDEKAMLEDLGPFLRDTVMWRPPVSEIRSLIPERLPPEIHEVVIGSGKAEEIREREIKLLEDLREQRQGKLAVFAQLQALRLACARMKLPDLTLLVQNLIQETSGHPFLVFSHHQEIVEAVAQAVRQTGISCGICHGGYTPKQRQQTVDAFQEGKLDALSLGIMAAREGLDIQRARCVVFAEFAWSPSDIAQAEGRAYRPGQEHALRTIYVVVPGTLDAYIAATLAAKDQAASTALGDLDPETITQALGGLSDLEDAHP